MWSLKQMADEDTLDLLSSFSGGVFMADEDAFGNVGTAIVAYVDIGAIDNYEGGSNKREFLP